MSTEGQYCSWGCRPTRGCRHSGRGDPKAQGDESRDRVAASWPSQRLHPPSLSLSLSLSLPLSILRSRHTTAHCPASTVCKRNFRKITLLYPRGARALFSSYRTKRATGPDPAPKWTMAHFSFRFGSGPLQLSYRRPSSKHRRIHEPSCRDEPSVTQDRARWLAEPRPERGKVARRATS